MKTAMECRRRMNGGAATRVWWGIWAFLALSLWVAEAEELFQFKTPRLSAYEVQVSGVALHGVATEAGDWIAGRSKDSGERRVEFGRRLALGISPGVEVGPMIEPVGLRIVKQVRPGLFLVEAPNARCAVRAAARLSRLPEVEICYPVIRKPTALDYPYAEAPNDPHFNPLYAGVVGQWYLEDRNLTNGLPRGVDLNVRSAWPLTEGEGVLVAVADIGVELDHRDLAIPHEGRPHLNFGAMLTNGTPIGSSSECAHGTSVASLIAAKGHNGFGMIGVAPSASIASWVIMQTPGQLVSDDRLMAMYEYASDRVQIQNHSWGHEGLDQQSPTPLEESGIARAIDEGRGGKGVILVRSAGNERARGARADDDGYTADPRVITVAAATESGLSATYSEPGACVLAAAPVQDAKGNGLFAADLSGSAGVNVLGFFPPFDYLSDFVFHSSGFGGTSAAAPLVSGIAAMVLSVRPDLSYRDVQQILVLSSRHGTAGDWDLTTNGAGLAVSHSLGFGIPDAGQAVRLAQRRVLCPDLTQIALTNDQAMSIPDGGLCLWVEGTRVPEGVRVLRGLPALGKHPDVPLGFLPLVDLGLATNPPSLDLHGKAALIQRGTNTYAEKIANAAAAGAVFAVIWNYATNAASGCPGGDQLCLPGGTTLSSIPALFIGYSDGSALQQAVLAEPDLEVRLGLTPLRQSFSVTNTLQCEHVGVRIKADHPLRGDLRITLVSPQGTRSVMQEYNADEQPGPVDWTYWSTHHFFESSAGVWQLEVTDERSGSSGQLLSATLVLRGVPIEDTDADGLDDTWERKHFGSLAQAPGNDPDGDGESNLMEQLLGSDPAVSDRVLEGALARWNGELLRFSWPGVSGETNTVWSSEDLIRWRKEAAVTGSYPETEWFAPITNRSVGFFRIESSLP